MKCQKNKITQYACQNDATVVRVTKAGKRIALCTGCDKRFGDIVGDKIQATNGRPAE